MVIAASISRVFTPGAAVPAREERLAIHDTYQSVGMSSNAIVDMHDIREFWTFALTFALHISTGFREGLKR
jgi:hypothetical protein